MLSGFVPSLFIPAVILLVHSTVKQFVAEEGRPRPESWKKTAHKLQEQIRKKRVRKRIQQPEGEPEELDTRNVKLADFTVDPKLEYWKMTVTIK